MRVRPTFDFPASGRRGPVLVSPGMSAPDAPTDPVDDPAAILTPERVTDLLNDAGHDVTVVDIAATPVGTGQMGASFRLALTFEGDPGEVPATIVAKTAAGPPFRRQISAGSYRTEIDFYRAIAPKVAIRLPRCWADWIADDATEFILLLEDLAPREQGDQIRGCTVEQARLAAVNLAGLHGPLWNDPWLASHLVPFDEAQAMDLDGVYPAMIEMFLQRFGHRLTEATRSTFEALGDLTGGWLAGRPTPFAPVHGDYRLDNLLFAPDGSDVAAVDWQTMSLGLPGRDLAYLCGTGLTVEYRRAAEDDIVAAYHDALVGFGVDGYDRGACRDDYAYGMLQGPLVTVFGSAVAEVTERGEEMFTAMAERSATAIDDLGSLALLR